MAPGPLEEGALRLGELPDPVPGPGQVLVELSVCGLCRTDIHICEGEINLPVVPVVPGHQGVGHVIENGEVGRPVGEMNVTGNLRDLFTRLEMVGNDPYPYSSTLAPSLVFSDVDFSGV